MSETSVRSYCGTPNNTSEVWHTLSTKVFIPSKACAVPLSKPLTVTSEQCQIFVVMIPMLSLLSDVPLRTDSSKSPNFSDTVVAVFILVKLSLNVFLWLRCAAERVDCVHDLRWNRCLCVLLLVCHTLTEITDARTRSVEFCWTPGLHIAFGLMLTLAAVGELSVQAAQVGMLDDEDSLSQELAATWADWVCQD